MSVRILLDDPHAFYTNLDFISGRVLLNLNSDENVSGIFVKLEGESRTILIRPTNPNLPPHLQRRDRNTAASENHKVLYKVNQVFPSESGSGVGTRGLAYTLRAGQHEYPFRFKIPFNNGCSDPQSQQNVPGTGGFGGINLGGMQQLQYRHVKRTLPPSLTGFPGEAEIRYYIKVTVQRPSLFKENRRSAIGFKFLPIEPPRGLKTLKEVYAKRQFEFHPGLVGGQKKGLFSKAKPPLSNTPPKGEIDARLPSPAILTCNEPLPLRLIVRKTNESPEQTFLMSLQVALIGTTEVRALDVKRTETSQWMMMSLQGLAIPIGSASDKVGTETLVDGTLWKSIPLPNTVAPSFHTCNLTRRYEVEVRVGLGYGLVGNIQPQVVTLPLRFQVEIYSGISPPAALLDAMASRPTPTPVRPTVNVPASRPPVSVPVSSPSRPTAQPAYDPAYPPQLAPNQSPEDDAPPSYEDAMADEITPADGPRREYSGVTDVNSPELDDKSPVYSPAQGNPGPGGPSRIV